MNQAEAARLAKQQRRFFVPGGGEKPYVVCPVCEEHLLLPGVPKLTAEL